MTANVTQFKKGHQLSVGNSGNTKPRMLTQSLISILNEEVKKGHKTKKLERICENLVQRAMGTGEDFDMDAIEFIFDRVEGKVATIAPDGEVVRPAGPTLMFSFAAPPPSPETTQKPGVVIDVTPTKKGAK